MLGAFLALMGLSGVLLVWKPWWIGVAGARPGTVPGPADTLAMIEQAERMGARHLVLPSAEFGLAQVGLASEAGAYLGPGGTVVAAWTSRWQRPELWLFDLHHELMAGDTGSVIVGLLGLAGVVLVLSGLWLWWPLRRGFALRALPRRLSRPAIRRHHRDLGAALSPLLVLLFLTGAMLAIRPVGEWLLAPLSSRAEVGRWNAVPDPAPHSSLAAKPNDWPRILHSAQAAFPTAKLRILVWPRAPGAHLMVRMRQPGEWHSNGRTTLWFAPGEASPVQVRDALAAPTAVAAFNLVWPVHAGKVGGLVWRLVLTAAGLALTLLGSLAALSFWRAPRDAARPQLRS